MPRTKDALRIEVSENAAEDMRVITVTIVASAQRFALTDLLRKRGAIGGIDSPLKQAVRDTIQRYLIGTEKLIAGLTAGQKKLENGAKPKAKTELEKEAPGAKSENGDKGAER
jgi:hypothetical protein